ncbi:iron-sulfur cluster assembly protein [Litorivicinus lipolyticus]|uniref:iron-sulfur cluster assembly protein n=1 Tax=Litorivicinus lipolyticus TaxID=418701 RepID=UPI003B5B9E38
MSLLCQLKAGDPLRAQCVVAANRVPAGTATELPADALVKVTQALGESLTVEYQGNLYRIASESMPALGVRPPEAAAAVADVAANDEAILAAVDAQLRTCYDPEIPVDIVELGLIYEKRLSQLLDGRTHLRVLMTLTAPGCGMGPVIVSDIKQKLDALPVDVVDVELTFDPPWDRSRMSEAAALATGMF